AAQRLRGACRTHEREQACGATGLGALGRAGLRALPAGLAAALRAAGFFFAAAFSAGLPALAAGLRAGALPPRRRSSAVRASTRALRPSRSSLPGTPRRLRARWTRSSNTFSRRAPDRKSTRL